MKWSEWHSSGRVAVDWMGSVSTEAPNLAEIEASDWSRVENPVAVQNVPVAKKWCSGN